MKKKYMMPAVLAFGIIMSLAFASVPVMQYKSMVDSKTKTYEVENKNGLSGTVQKEEKSELAFATSNLKIVVAKSKVEEKKEEVKQPAVQEVQKPAESVTYSNREPSVDTSSVVNAAYSLLGTRYTAGGSNPSTGFDCSGFVSYIYGVIGTSIGRSSSAQLGNGSAVSESDLQPGDIIIWANNGSSSASHSSIYAGDGTIIHATSNKGVQQTNLSSWKNWGQHIIGIRRI